MRRLDWAQRRAPEFENVDPKTAIAILPTAAIEQHGPHLPVGTDTLIMEGMLNTFRKSCPDDLDPWILPIQAVGKSNEHLWAKGTLTLTATTALTAWTEIGLSVARAGFKKIVIVNSHGGNLDLISILSRELRVEAGMLAVKCQWGNFGHPDGMYGDYEKKFGIHGGDVETSLMLDFAAESVDMSHATHFASTAETDLIPPIGPISRGWIASDLNPDGTVGDASLATAEKGRATAEHQVAGFVALLRQVRDMPLPDAAAKI
ncbi:creatininase family protein [Yoonia sp. BS5-3]|uniref:Creatininase family protein n=1 Tax=Yoonia phaeophyticola TaxID=3137369 RepID=A0ABZ2V7W7_9RHOB